MIELIGEFTKISFGEILEQKAAFADYLISNGVILLCKDEESCGDCMFYSRQISDPPCNDCCGGCLRSPLWEPKETE